MNFFQLLIDLSSVCSIELIIVMLFLIGVKTDMEERQRAWKKEQDDHSEIFRKLCKCRKKTLGKGDEDIVLSVAKK